MKTMNEIYQFLAEQCVEIQLMCNGETYRAVRYNGAREECNVEVIWEDTADELAEDKDAVASCAYDILTGNY